MTARCTLYGLLALTMTCTSVIAQTAVHEAVPSAKIIRLSPALDAVLAPDTPIEKVATGFQWTEGPLWHDGALWFSDLSGNKMYSLSPEGKLQVLLDHAGGLQSFAAGMYGGPNAMAVDKQGDVLMMQHGMRRIVQLDGQNQPKVFLDKYDGKPFNSPNDMVFSKDGALYFTDPPYGFFDPTQPNKNLDADPHHAQTFNGVYRYKDGKLTAVITDQSRPNGLAFSANGKILYVANSQNPAVVYQYAVQPDGSLKDRRIFADMSKESGDGVPDGMRLDSLGNLWTSGPGGFHIYSPSGQLLGKITFPEIASNLAWGGPDGKTAYFTGGTSIYRLTAKVPGKLPTYR